MRATADQPKSTDHDKEQQDWEQNPPLPPVNRIAEKNRTTHSLRVSERPRTTRDALKTASQGLKQLNDALYQGQNEAMESFLSTTAKFHNYTPNNNFLIRAQFPLATQVARYDKWQELGRQVRRNEKGIAIIEPVMTKQIIEVENSSGEIEEREVARPSGFDICHVYDISQTTGKSTPESTKMADEPEAVLMRLEQAFDYYGIQLVYDDPDQVNGDNPTGETEGTARGGLVAVNPDQSPNNKISALVYELAHALLDKGKRRFDSTTQSRDTEALAVVFAVSKAVGLDLAAQGADYTVLHSEDVDVLKESLRFIQKTASKIIWNLQKEDSDDEQPF